MNYGKTLAVCALSLLMGSAQASTVNYILDKSDRLINNVNYISLSISDDTEGQLDFWVQPGSSALEGPLDEFGIFSFGFNLQSTGRKPVYERTRNLKMMWQSMYISESEERDSGVSVDDLQLPDGWGVEFESNNFDVNIFAEAGVDELHFSVLGLSLEDLGRGFGAYVEGLGASSHECAYRPWDDCGDIKSRAFIHGYRLVVVEPPSAVPVPAAAWLFASGLIGLVGVSRRTRHAHS